VNVPQYATHSEADIVLGMSVEQWWHNVGKGTYSVQYRELLEKGHITQEDM